MSEAKQKTRTSANKEYNAYSPDMKTCPHCGWEKAEFTDWYQAAYTATTVSAGCAWPWHIKLCGTEDDSGNAANPTEEEKRTLPKVARQLKEKVGWKTKPLKTHKDSPKDRKRRLHAPFEAEVNESDADASDGDYHPPNHSVKRPRKQGPAPALKPEEKKEPPKPLNPLEALLKQAQEALVKAQTDKQKLGDRGLKLIEECDEIKRLIVLKEEEIAKIDKIVKAS